jgi:hypothetical protein
MRAVVITFGLGLLLGGCYASGQVRKLAANDFGCPADDIVVHELDSGYLARGCKKEARYTVQDGGWSRISEVTKATVDERPELSIDRVPGTNSVGID